MAQDIVPFLDLQIQHAEIAAELDEAWRRVTATSRFVGGELVERFEAEWAAYCNTRHCVGVSDGTAVIKLARRAYRLVVFTPHGRVWPDNRSDRRVQG